MPWTYWEAVKQNTCFQFTPSVFRGFCWNYVTIPFVTSTCIFLHMKPFSPNSSLVCVGISLTVCERWHHHLTQISLPYHHPKDPWTHLLHHSTHSTPHSLAEHLAHQQLLIPEGLQCQVSQLPMIFPSKSVCSLVSSLTLLCWHCSMAPVISRSMYMGTGLTATGNLVSSLQACVACCKQIPIYNLFLSCYCRPTQQLNMSNMAKVLDGQQKKRFRVKFLKDITNVVFSPLPLLLQIP